MCPKLSHVSRMELCKTACGECRGECRGKRIYSLVWSANARNMFKVIFAGGMSSCQKLIGKDGWVPASIAMKCRLKVCIARSALLDRFVNERRHELVLNLLCYEVLP
jgi:hypothetical protein